MRTEQHGWQLMYLGAFAAMLVENAEAAKYLAELTESDEECIKVIVLMRMSKEGDRVYPALEWLRGQRQASDHARANFEARQRPSISGEPLMSPHPVGYGHLPTMSKPFPPAEDDDRAEMQREGK